MSTDVFVQFGASGDLAKKMTFVSLYRLARRGRLRVPVVGVAFDDWDDDTYRAHFRAGVEAAGEQVDAALWGRMSAGMRYVHGDYTKPDVYDRVREAIGGAAHPLFYLQIPPDLFETVVRGWIGFVEGASIDWCANPRLTRAELRDLLAQVLLEIMRVAAPAVFSERA